MNRFFEKLDCISRIGDLLNRMIDLISDHSPLFIRTFVSFPEILVVDFINDEVFVLTPLYSS